MFIPALHCPIVIRFISLNNQNGQSLLFLILCSMILCFLFKLDYQGNSCLICCSTIKMVTLLDDEL